MCGRVDVAGVMGRDRRRVGGAVKAGLLVPPVGGALTVPVVQLSPATISSDRPAGRSRSVMGLDTAGLIIALVLSWAAECSAPAIPSRWFA